MLILTFKLVSPLLEIEELEESSDFNMLKFDFFEFQAIPSLVDKKTLIGVYIDYLIC